MKALIIVDIQYDFLEDGRLEVSGGNEVIPVINALQTDFELIVATQDWHPHNHKSFAAEHPGKNEFDVIDLNGLQQVLWPVHCVQGTQGAEFHKDLKMNSIEAIFRKGMDREIDSYSGFYDNGKRKNTGLYGYLKDRNVSEVFVAGLAADFCVYFTANDAIDLGFKTTIIEEASKPIDAENWEKLKDAFFENGGNII
ncbi:MAG: bifunctional nicotinamidase/pyrazinamidase [Weeksellaceae bacterium]|nr:bifunctional nicotinamidase/pyrazinamidase [Weeksellaceae bacterium]